MFSTRANSIDLHPELRGAGRTSAVSHLPALKPAEISFMLGLMSQASDGEAPAFPSGCDAAVLWEYVERHGLGGVLGACADRIADLPPALAEAAQRRYWSNCLHGQQARKICSALLEAGRRTGVTVFFVKGPALADQAYGDDGLRGFSDLDVFTGSADEARRLAKACAGRVLTDSEQQNLCSEIRDSGRLLIEMAGWPVEIRFPVAGWHGPLFDLFPAGRLPELVWTANGLPVPNAEWHFLFLLYHQMVHHFFGRFIWFLDLAVLKGSERARLNWERVVAEADRLSIREALAAAAGFCRRHVDPDFPEVPLLPGVPWNRAFIRHLVKPQVVVVSGRNTQQISAARVAWAILHGTTSYLLLADAPATGRLWMGRGGQWTEARVRCVLTRRWTGAWGNWLGCRLAAPVPGFLYPLARLLAWLPSQRD